MLEIQKLKDQFWYNKVVFFFMSKYNSVNDINEYAKLY